MVLSGLAADDAAKITGIAISDEKVIRRLADLGVFAGAEIILEGGSVKRKFFVISAGGRTVGLSLDIANSITVEKLRGDMQGSRNLDGKNSYSENERILRAESAAHIRGGA